MMNVDRKGALANVKVPAYIG